MSALFAVPEAFAVIRSVPVFTPEESGVNFTTIFVSPPPGRRTAGEVEILKEEASVPSMRAAIEERSKFPGFATVKDKEPLLPSSTVPNIPADIPAIFNGSPLRDSPA
jgi:hypothetical protein